MGKQFVHKGAGREIHNRRGRHTRIEQETELAGKRIYEKMNRDPGITYKVQWDIG